MEEPQINEKKKLIDKLKKFWKEHLRNEADFFKKKRKIEKEMNKVVGLGVDVGFFYVDGECVGIGADNFSDRKNFPLIHDSELWEEN